jgi:fatty acid-binding protein DegV
VPLQVTFDHGTYRAANAAVKAALFAHVYLCDRPASMGLGLLALRDEELAESGWPAAAIVTELERIRAQSGMFLIVDTYENLIRSVRVSRGKAWLAGRAVFYQIEDGTPTRAPAGANG